MKKIMLLIVLILTSALLIGCSSDCEHEEEVWEGVKATCQSTGLTDGIKCSKCGKVLKEREETPKIDHIYGEYYDYSLTKHCRDCEMCENREYENHTYDNGVLIEENQETGRAKTKFTCTVCGSEYIVEHEINAIVFPPMPLS